VLEVGVKGMVNVLDACLPQIPELVWLPVRRSIKPLPRFPPEEAPLVVPDPFNPRYSYGGGKIISELMTIHYGKRYFERV